MPAWKGNDQYDALVFGLEYGALTAMYPAYVSGPTSPI